MLSQAKLLKLMSLSIPIRMQGEDEKAEEKQAEEEEAKDESPALTGVAEDLQQPEIDVQPEPVQHMDDEQYDLDQWKDGEGRYLALSPMYMAVKFGHYDVVQLFTDRGSVDDMESALTAAAEVKR